jgi:hypothetical protein
MGQLVVNARCRVTGRGLSVLEVRRCLAALPNRDRRNENGIGNNVQDLVVVSVLTAEGLGPMASI